MILFNLFVLAIALLISGTSAYYSIVGLTAIFPAAFWSIVVMGSALELGKIAASLWLKLYWDLAARSLKLYLSTAVVILMFITSMGIFGGLSRAHLEQSAPVGDISAQVAAIDERITTQKENIESARRSLKQLDEAVDQMMSRTTDAQGANRSVILRRQQAPERNRLQAEIEQAQKTITALNEQRAPMAGQLRQVELEVGPIKYIAALIYGDNPDANLLERAVRWVIILLILVFDPLALALLIAVTVSLPWERARRQPAVDSEIIPHQVTEPAPKPSPVTEPAPTPVSTDPAPVVTDIDLDLELDDQQDPGAKAAMIAWKQDNPNDTLKRHRQMLREGQITKLPWNEPPYRQLAQRLAVTEFGRSFPNEDQLGRMFVSTTTVPHQVYTVSDLGWSRISDEHVTYGNDYIDHLISLIEIGEYDAKYLTDTQRDHITQRLSR